MKNIITPMDKFINFIIKCLYIIAFIATIGACHFIVLNNSLHFDYHPHRTLIEHIILGTLYYAPAFFYASMFINSYMREAPYIIRHLAFLILPTVGTMFLFFINI